MSSNQDQARLIAERVARRLSGLVESSERADVTPESGSAAEPAARPRARVVNFVATSAPPITPSSIRSVANPTSPAPSQPETRTGMPTQSPWLAPFTRPSSDTGYPVSQQLPSHPSQERFGVEEAAVSELVEFFENEKQCAVDPSGKPCDHCAMCSSRGF